MSDSELRFCYARKTDVPAGDWWVNWEGRVVRGGDWGDLVSNCQKVTVELGRVPPPDLPMRIENALCSRLAGDPNCVPCSHVASQSVNFGSIVRWVRAMYSFATQGGFQLVDQEEAERRAEICAKCPMQVSTSGCWGCKGIAGMLPAIAGARKTPYDGQLKACGVCGCYNAVSVHLPKDVQEAEGLNFPDWCWKKPSPPQIV
jgi:hypothetical protein